MDNKKIIFNDEARLKLKQGIDIVANAVKVTLGYGGRTVVIRETGFPARATKDGVTVANSIKLKDDLLDAGANMMKEVSAKTGDDVGDGTTTVCVLTQELLNEGLKYLQDGGNPVYLKKGMDLAKDMVLNSLKEMTIPITPALIKNIAAVSANNDKEIGDLIGDAYEKLGQHGTITIEDSNGTDTRVELIEGFQFDCGMFSPHFITNTAKNTCEIENPYLLVVEGKIADISQVWPIMQEVAKSGKGLVIIAEDFDFSVPTNLLNNRALFKSCIIKYNFSGDTKQEIMYDLCAVSGATIAEKKGAKIESLGIEYLGQCEKMIISKDETILIKGKNSAKEMEARIQDAKVKIENAKHPFIKQKQEKRLAKLSGCMAVCYVGGATEVEISEKKDRIDDSIRATKAAIEMGVVAGGGTALLRCATFLSCNHPDNDTQNGMYIVKSSCLAPAKQIIQNAGDNIETLIPEILRRDGNYGYNVASGGIIEDLIQSGIVDPVKVVATCIENAVSAAGQVLMSEALIVSDNS